MISCEGPDTGNFHQLIPAYSDAGGLLNVSTIDTCSNQAYMIACKFNIFTERS
jgi:hypothetical protein